MITKFCYSNGDLIVSYECMHFNGEVNVENDLSYNGIMVCGCVCAWACVCVCVCICACSGLMISDETSLMY